jgi:hypothetical protein
VCRGVSAEHHIAGTGSVTVGVGTVGPDNQIVNAIAVDITGGADREASAITCRCAVQPEAVRAVECGKLHDGRKLRWRCLRDTQRQCGGKCQRRVIQRLLSSVARMALPLPSAVSCMSTRPHHSKRSAWTMSVFSSRAIFRLRLTRWPRPPAWSNSPPTHRCSLLACRA